MNSIDLSGILNNFTQIKPGKIANDIGKKCKNVAIQTVTLMGSAATAINAATSVRRQDQSDHVLRMESRDKLSRKESTKKQYLQMSTLTCESKEEAESFLREEGQLSSTESLQDTHTLKGPVQMRFPFQIPGVTNSKRNLINLPNKGKKSNGNSPINKKVKTRSQSQEEKTSNSVNEDSARPQEEKTSNSVNEDSARSQEEKTSNSVNEDSARPVQKNPSDSKIIKNTKSYYVCSESESEMETEKSNHSFSGSSSALVDSSPKSIKETQLQQAAALPFANAAECGKSVPKTGLQVGTSPPTPVLSVPLYPSVWATAASCFTFLLLGYIFIVPLVEKGSASVRKVLNLPDSKNLSDDLNTIVTPSINNLDEKSIINPMEILIRYNEKKLTLKQAKLLLKKGFFFNKEEIEVLLEKDL